jgi:hypothetical protein
MARDGWLLAIFIDQIQPPIKLQKEEKLANLIIYEFTINQFHMYLENIILQVITHKYMEDFTERRFPTLICTKE